MIHARARCSAQTLLIRVSLAIVSLAVSAGAAVAGNIAVGETVFKK
jgi:hypothetical protein